MDNYLIIDDMVTDLVFNTNLCTYTVQKKKDHFLITVNIDKSFCKKYFDNMQVQIIIKLYMNKNLDTEARYCILNEENSIVECYFEYQEHFALIEALAYKALLTKHIDLKKAFCLEE